MNKNIFQKIIENETFSYKIVENEDHLAFLDIYPIKIGHTLVITKRHNRDKIFSLSEKDFISIMSFSRKVAIGMEKTIPCKRIGLFIMGFEIPHIHIHLIPMDHENDANFLKKRINISQKKLEFLSKEIKKNINL
ncbi:HIT family protein [Blattabacterium cuenoti]|uniref:HIT family protein n=1 Tax=Blattabacterium cuenoti TaxID=1653831 RepID=UPI00163CE108|nr:HIT family protein [Blattabacterium cuenoti]